MSLNLTCFNINFPLPLIPINNNVTNFLSHTYYNSNGKAISQLISSSLTRSTFSIADVRLFLNTIISNEIKSLDVSTIIKTKPVTSTIIYLSIILVLFIILSIIFYIISFTNCCKRKSINEYQEKKIWKFSKQYIFIVLISVISLIVISQMIYITYHISKTKTYLDDSIKIVNQEIYPKEISLYLQHLLKQLEQLDKHSTQANSTVIKASQSIFFKAFHQIFREKYFLNEILQLVNDTDINIIELDNLIQKENVSQVVNIIFQVIKNEHKKMISNLKQPLQELCNYANGNNTDIDNTIIKALDLVHQQIIKVIDTIQNNFLNRITPWEKAMLMKNNLEDKIRWYIHLVGIILLVLIITFGLIPIFFIIFIIIHHFYDWRQNVSSSKYRIDDNQQNDLSRISESSIENEKSISNDSSTIIFYWIRIIFIIMIIMLFVIILGTSILYGVNLVIQGICRTVHDDQSYIVSLITNKVFGTNSNNVIIGGSNITTTLTTIMDDCENRIHFSEHFFKNHFNHLENNVDHAMNQLNKKIFDKFNTSIIAIDIKSDLNQLIQFSSLMNSSNIGEKAEQIVINLRKIDILFENITISVPTLPNNLVNQSINDFKDYLKRVLNSTIDACPLPLATIYKADTLICHQFSTSINGLWFSIFLYMFFIIFGLCIGGLCIYKQLQSLSSNSSLLSTDYF